LRGFAPALCDYNFLIYDDPEVDQPSDEGRNMTDTPVTPPPEPAAPEPEIKPLKPAVEAALSGNSEPLRVYSHSSIIYWWPVWVLGLIFWALSSTLFSGSLSAHRVMGVTFAFSLLFVIFSTTVRLRGANSVIFGLVLVIGFILMATSGLTGALGKFIRSLDVTFSNTAYLVLGLGVFLQWSLMYFGFDRVKFWDVVPGQMHERLFWGSGDKSENGANAKCQYKADDFLRHRILGLMMTGDLEIQLGDGRRWELHNVLFARQKAKRINQLIVMRPID